MSSRLRTAPGEVTRPYPRCIRIALVYLSILLSPSMASAEVSARLDRSAVSLDETVQLVLESDGKPESRPDLSVLAPDFEILDRRASHNVSIVNGERSELHVLTLRLRPRRAGDLTIPPIPFGDRETASLQLSVTAPPGGTSNPAGPSSAPAAADDPVPAPTVLLETSLEPEQGYTGQQLILTARVFMDGLVRGPRLHDPQIPDVGVLPLGEDSYQTKRDGTNYRVYERRYALFPRSPGRLQIGPLRFEGWPASGSMRSRPDYPSPGQPVRVLSGILAAKILPAPGGEGKDGWLPARSLTLAESGPKTYQTRTGQPIERRISLIADGIMARDLPALAISVPHQLTKRRRQPRLTDQRRPEGVIGTRQEVLVFSAREPGRYRLPPISLDWWSTTAERWETATLPARDLVVSASTASAPGLLRSDADAAVESGQQRSQSDQTRVPFRTTATDGSRRNGTGVPSNLWFWIAAVIALAWIATMAGWWRSKKQTAQTTPAPAAAAPAPTSDAAEPLRSAIDAVRASYEAGDAAAAREALLAWAGETLPEQTPSNLARLAQRCPQPLRGQILLLEQAFFSPNAIEWDKHPVWEELERFEPAPLEEPASFRRSKPIRRRTANPDAD